MLGRAMCTDGKPLPVRSTYSAKPPFLRYLPDKFSPRVTAATAGDYKIAAKLWGGGATAHKAAAQPQAAHQAAHAHL